MRALHYLEMSLSPEMEHFHQVEKRHTIDLDLQYKVKFLQCNTYLAITLLDSIFTFVDSDRFVSNL